MEIIKRDQSVQAYDRRKISRAVSAAFASVGHPLPEMTKEAILDQVEVQIRRRGGNGPGQRRTNSGLGRTGVNASELL